MHRVNDVAPTSPEPSPASARPAAGDERSLRERTDELLIEFESLDLSAPRWTIEERAEAQERHARASYAEALVESDEAGVDPPEFLIRHATESLALLDADAFVDELDKDDEVAALGSTADHIRDYVRFERFGPVEARRRRRLAKNLRDRALRARGEYGGYLAARVHVVVNMRQPPRHATRNLRPSGRRRRSGRSSRARSPGREPPEPPVAPPGGGR